MDRSSFSNSNKEYRQIRKNKTLPLSFKAALCFLYHFYSGLFCFVDACFKTADVFCQVCIRFVPMFSDEVHHAAASDGAISQTRHGFGLLRRMDAKADSNGRIRGARMIFTMSLMSVLMSLRIPVTPMEETRYTKPVASFTLVRIRSSEVGATIWMMSTPY